MSAPNKKTLNRVALGLQEKLPIKVIQFGEGNFLRAFVDYAIQQLNKTTDFNGGVAVIQPIERGMVEVLNNQEGLFTLFLKGVQNGKEIQEKELITTIVEGINPYINFQKYLNLAKEESLEFIFSNTTEAGITYIDTDTADMSPPFSFPAKLTALLYERFTYFNGAADKGLTIIPCELINHNSEILKEIIFKYAKLWKAGSAFVEWIEDSCSFHSTLVDRIVPGYPKDDIKSYNDELEYQDSLIVSAEVFFLWVIEGGEDLKRKLPFHKIALDVKIVEDMQPYRTRKVRILNGAHTSMVPFSLLYGNKTVKETVDTPFTGDFVNKAIFEEINETLPMEKEELDAFAKAVLDRFRNPFVKHNLADIALNSISKFKVRVLPSLLEYKAQKGKLPTHLTFAFACLIRFYKGSWQSKSLPIQDSDEVVLEFKKIWKEPTTKEVVLRALQNKDFWDMDLTSITGLPEAITEALGQIEAHGIEVAFTNFSLKY